MLLKKSKRFADYHLPVFKEYRAKKNKQKSHLKSCGGSNPMINTRIYATGANGAPDRVRSRARDFRLKFQTLKTRIVTSAPPVVSSESTKR